MKSASEMLDSLEERAREDAFVTFVSGTLRIDCRYVFDAGVVHWSVDGRPCSRETAEAALMKARAAKGHPFASHTP